MSGQHCLLAEGDIGAPIPTSVNSSVRLTYFHTNRLLNELYKQETEICSRKYVGYIKKQTDIDGHSPVSWCCNCCITKRFFLLASFPIIRKPIVFRKWQIFLRFFLALSSFIFEAVLKQDHYMTHLLSYANTVLWCSYCKIPVLQHLPPIWSKGMKFYAMVTSTEEGKTV